MCKAAAITREKLVSLRRIWLFHVRHRENRKNAFDKDCMHWALQHVKMQISVKGESKDENELGGGKRVSSFSQESSWGVLPQSQDTGNTNLVEPVLGAWGMQHWIMEHAERQEYVTESCKEALLNKCVILWRWGLYFSGDFKIFEIPGLWVSW